MNKNVVAKIIKEELADFDFLGNDAHLSEEDDLDLLRNEDFQRQLIVDSLLDSNKIQIDIKNSSVENDWENDLDVDSKLSIEYIIDVEYKYDSSNEPVKFELTFSCDSAPITGAEEGESWYETFDWNKISVDLSSANNVEVKFKAFEKAPDEIKAIFIREFVKDFVSDATSADSHTEKTQDVVQNVSHV